MSGKPSQMYSTTSLRVVLYGPSVLLGVWVISTVALVVLEDACQFQRLGSLFVAIAVLLFAVTNTIQSKIRSEWQWRMIELASNKAILVSSERLLDVLNKLRLIPQDSTCLNELREHGIDPAEESAKTFENLLDKIQRKSVRLEALIVVLATLQWGYGDLLINSICGGTPC